MLDTTTALEANATLAPDEVFVLKRGIADRASVSEGTLCLVCPDGTFATVDVPKGDVARIARTLLGHPAVLLLAREGVALPKALPVPGNPLPIDTALPGTVAVANRLRRLAETLDMSTAASLELLALADDLSRAPDPCEGYPTAEAVLRTCDAVIAEMRRDVGWTPAAACQRLRDRLAEVMAARPAHDAAPRGGVTADVVDGWATALLDLAYRPDARDRAVSLAETLRVAAAEARKAPARTYADGVTDAGTAVARVALTYCAGTRGRIAADECQDAIAALRASTPTTPAVPFDPALHLTRAEVVADLRFQRSLAEVQSVNLDNNGHRMGAEAMRETCRRLSDLAAKYEVRA